MKSVSAVIDRPRATGPSPLWHHLMALSWREALSLFSPFGSYKALALSSRSQRPRIRRRRKHLPFRRRCYNNLWHAGASSCLRLQRRSAVRVCQAGEGWRGGGGEAKGIRPLLPVTCILLFTFLSPKTLAFRSNAVSLTHSFILCLTFTSPPPCVCVFWAILRPFSCSFSKARS